MCMFPCERHHWLTASYEVKIRWKISFLPQQPAEVAIHLAELLLYIAVLKSRDAIYVSSKFPIHEN